MVDYSKKPPQPVSAYAAYVFKFRQDFASEHSNDPNPTSSIEIGHLARQEWNVLSEPAKITALMLEMKRMDEYDDALESHVAYMKFMRGCLHKNQKTGQFEERWKQLESEVNDLINKYSVLKDKHIKLLLDATEKTMDDMDDDDDEEEEESQCTNLRLFLKAKGMSSLEEKLHKLGEEWDQLRFGEMEVLAKRSLLNAEEIQLELDGMKKDVDEKLASGKNEDRALQLQEMDVQARKSGLMGNQIRVLLKTMKKGSEATNNGEQQDLEKDDEQDLEKDDKQDLGVVDDNKKLSNLIEAVEDMGFLMKHDADFISGHLHWIDSNTKKEWDLEWQQVHLEEEQLKDRRLTLKA